MTTSGVRTAGRLGQTSGHPAEHARVGEASVDPGRYGRAVGDVRIAIAETIDKLERIARAGDTAGDAAAVAAGRVAREVDRAAERWLGVVGRVAALLAVLAEEPLGAAEARIAQ